MKSFLKHARNYRVPVIPEPIHFKMNSQIINEDNNTLRNGARRYVTMASSPYLQSFPDNHMIRWLDKNDNSHLHHHEQQYLVNDELIDKKYDHLRRFDDDELSFHDGLLNESGPGEAHHHRDIIDKLFDHNKQYDQDHRNSIGKYTSGSSVILNNILLKRFDALNNYHPDHIENVKNSMDHLSPFIKNNLIQHAHKTFSGVSFNPDEYFKHSDIIHSPAFISSSLSKKTAMFYSKLKSTRSIYDRHILQFHLEPGDRASHISPLSSFKSECETIIDKGLNIKKIGHEDYVDSNSGNIRIHHVKIV